MTERPVSYSNRHTYKVQRITILSPKRSCDLGIACAGECYISTVFALFWINTPAQNFPIVKICVNYDMLEP